MAAVAVFANLGLSSSAPAVDNPGVPCVGFYFTTCSLIDVVPEDPQSVVDALCRRADCPS
jgi:hypothetical protein